MTPTDLTLYSYWRSSSSWRVRICLALKSIPYKTVPIHLVKGEQVADQYLDAVNKMGQVPALAFTLDGKRHIVTQSLAIIDFLERAFPGVDDSTSLFRSGDIEAHAFALSFSEIINSGIQPLQNLDTCTQITKGSGGSMNGRVFGKAMIEKGLASLEKLVSDRWLHSSGFDVSCPSNTETAKSKFFVLGVSPLSLESPSPLGPSIADACLIPQLYNARRFDVDVSKYPCLLLIESHCVKERAFVEASPDKQPDAELPPPPPPVKAEESEEKDPKKPKI